VIRRLKRRGAHGTWVKCRICRCKGKAILRWDEDPWDRTEACQCWDYGHHNLPNDRLVSASVVTLRTLGNGGNRRWVTYADRLGLIIGTLPSRQNFHCPHPWVKALIAKEVNEEVTVQTPPAVLNSIRLENCLRIVWIKNYPNFPFPTQHEWQWL